MIKRTVKMIKWKDAANHTGWQSVAEDFPLMIVDSIGFVIQETDEYVTLTTSLTEHDDATEPFSIPKFNIISMRDICIDCEQLNHRDTETQS